MGGGVSVWMGLNGLWWVFRTYTCRYNTVPIIGYVVFSHTLVSWECAYTVAIALTLPALAIETHTGLYPHTHTYTFAHTLITHSHTHVLTPHTHTLSHTHTYLPYTLLLLINHLYNICWVWLLLPFYPTVPCFLSLVTWNTGRILQCISADVGDMDEWATGVG